MPKSFNSVPNDIIIADTASALTEHGFATIVVDDLAAAKAQALELVPKGAEVFTATSRTLDDTGLTAAINESGEYNATRQQFYALASQPERRAEMRRLAAAPEYVMGSVHALTQTGEVLVASATGSQLPAYAFGAGRVIWIVGAQKIVRDLAEAGQRLRQHTFPLEDARAQRAYGHGSNINKELIFHREATPDRITIILIKQVVGF